MKNGKNDEAFKSNSLRTDSFLEGDSLLFRLDDSSSMSSAV